MINASNSQRILIVNADDFGQSVGVNNGILRAHNEGIVTSASLMVRGNAAEDAVRRAGNLALGLHIDLGEWVCSDGEWGSLYERVSLVDQSAVEEEIRYQLGEFRRLTATSPTHLDSHQHVHMELPVRTVVRRLAKELSVPLRRCEPRIRYCGRFYGQSGEGATCGEQITVEALIAVLTELPLGITELATHPGEDLELNSMYRDERFQETRTLCDPRVREVVVAQGIKLCSFAELPAVWTAGASESRCVVLPAPR